jgi:flagellar hook assembly protein FlgD
VTVSAGKGNRRTPLIARVVFAGLVVATLAAFFISQHLKVTTPFIAGVPHPDPPAINPQNPYCHSTRVSFFLLHHVDNVDVYVVNQSGTTVRSLVRGLFMSKKETRSFTWNGRDTAGRPVTPGSYFFRVYLIHQERPIEIQQPVRVVTSTRCN